MIKKIREAIEITLELDLNMQKSKFSVKEQTA